MSLTLPLTDQPTPTPCLLEARNLCFSFGAQPLLQGIHWCIPPGLSAITGDESSGKTTLLRLLAGELQATAGAVLWGSASAAPGGNVGGPPVFWVDPRSDAWDAMPVRDYLGQARHRHATLNAGLLGELFDALHLTDHLDKRFAMLSTGSRRKVFLATAFASGAAVTLLDMPFAALDGASIRVVHALLAEAAEHPHRAWVVADYVPPPDLPLAAHCHLPGP